MKSTPASLWQCFLVVLVALFCACTTTPVEEMPESPDPELPDDTPGVETPPVKAPAPPDSADLIDRALRPATWNDLPGWREDNLAEALPALLASCSMLNFLEEWKAPCAEAAILSHTPEKEVVRAFFENHFAVWQVANPDGSRTGLVTGYYEPLIQGSLEPSAGYDWPVFGVPMDLLRIELDGIHPKLKGMHLRGRLEDNKIVPYWTRAEIDAKGNTFPADILLWAKDPVELFFLHIQGSGKVELPSGKIVRIGYADNNSHPYKSIGRWLADQGELPLERTSMQNIKEWVKKNPGRLKTLLNVNPRYIFFRESPDAVGGPVGALNVPISSGRSIAVDPSYIPLGAPVFLSTTFPASKRPLNRLMVAQDTGGAIKGAVRADFYWGSGPEAGAQAGRMRQQGRMWVLLPAAPPR